jgi:hypothetical protein
MPNVDCCHQMPDVRRVERASEDADALMSAHTGRRYTCHHRQSLRASPVRLVSVGMGCSQHSSGLGQRFVWKCSSPSGCVPMNVRLTGHPGCRWPGGRFYQETFPNTPIRYDTRETIC